VTAGKTGSVSGALTMSMASHRILLDLLLGRWLGVSGLDSAGTGLFQAADRHAPLAGGVTRLPAKRLKEVLREIKSVASRIARWRQKAAFC
jgi:hypothetical protein